MSNFMNDNEKMKVYPAVNPYMYNLYLYKKRENYIMELQGEGIVKVKPDIAIIYLGVVTESKDVKKAQKENSLKTNMVIDAIKNVGINEEDIETLSYEINKKYDYIDGKQHFRGYEVKNILKITVRDLDKIGEVYDAAVDNGANIAKNIVFTVSEPQKYYREALKLAVKDAEMKAIDISKTSGVTINKVPIKIKEEYTDRLKAEYSPYAGIATDGKSTPIQPRELEIKAKVKMTFGYH